MDRDGLAFGLWQIFDVGEHDLDFAVEVILYAFDLDSS